MRLRDMLGILEQNLPKLNLAGKPIQGGTPQDPFISVSGLALLREALDELRTIDALSKFATRVVTVGLPFQAPEVVVVQSLYQELQQALNQLRNRGELLLEVLGQVSRSEKTLEIGVSLPSDVQSLAALADLIGDINLAVVSPLESLKLPPPSFVGFEVGSDWVQLVFEQQEAFDFVIGLTVLALEYTKVKLEHERREREAALALAAEGEPDEGGAASRERLDKVLDAVTRRLVQRARSGKYSKADQETDNRIFASLRKLSDLATRGAQVRPGLGSPVHPKVRAELEESLRQVGSAARTFQLPASPAEDEPSDVDR